MTEAGAGKRERAETLSSVLERALRDETSGLPPSRLVDWTLVSVATRFLMGAHLPVAAFARDGKTLAFIVTPTDPGARVYKRTARLDVVYFSEDAPDAEQQTIYDRDKASIDAFVTWLGEWDARGEPLP